MCWRGLRNYTSTYATTESLSEHLRREPQVLFFDYHFTGVCGTSTQLPYYNLTTPSCPSFTTSLLFLAIDDLFCLISNFIVLY
jgi:hypothetical protein